MSTDGPSYALLHVVSGERHHLGWFQLSDDPWRVGLVTAADVASQQTIQKILLDAFPRHGFLGEENTSIPAGADGYRWIVDPLDGTTNYVHGIPHYAVSIALERRGELVAGVVYEPVGDECFTASARGGGVKRHSATRLRISSAMASSNAIAVASGRAAAAPPVSNLGTSR